MAKTLSIKTGKGIEIGNEKEVKAKIGNGIDFGNDNEVVAKGNTAKAIQVSEDGIELKVDNTTAKINDNGELEVVATKPDISAGGGINLETPTGDTTTEISVKTDNTTTRINTNGELEAIGTKPDIEAGAGIELETPTGETTTTISVKTDNTTINKNANGELEVIEQDPKITQGNGIIVNIDGEHTAQIRAKGGNGIDVNANGINVKTDNITTRINANGQVEAIGTKPDIEAGNGIELETPTGETTTTIKAKASNGIVVDTNGISADINTDTLEFDNDGKINVKDKAPNIESGNGIEIATSGNTKTISANINTDTLEFDNNGKINVKDKAPNIESGNGIEIAISGNTKTISANINTDTLEFDNNGKINVKDKAPNIESGNGIEIATSGNTKTITAKGGNGIGVGSSGISVNTGSGIHISSNKVGINANFTKIDTPLGDNESNINLHSDGKISITNSGGNSEMFLYGTIPYETLLSKSKNINIQNVNKQLFNIIFDYNEIEVINPIDVNQIKDYIYMPMAIAEEIGYGYNIRTPYITSDGNYIINTYNFMGTGTISKHNLSTFMNESGYINFGEFYTINESPNLHTLEANIKLYIYLEIYKISGNITPQTVYWQLTSQSNKCKINIYAIKKPT